MEGKRIRTVVRLLAFGGCALVVAACGGSDDDSTDAGATTDTTAATTSTAADDTTTSVDETTTTTAPETTTTTEAEATTTTLAGSVIEFGPQSGDVLAVVGVAHDDVLNVRDGPGVGADIVDELAPTENFLVALGVTRDLSPGFWIEVETGAASGWVNLVFVAYEGVVTDETATVLDAIGAGTDADVEALGAAAAGVFASEDPASDVVMVVAPSGTDVVEVVHDVIGVGDDAVRGFRVHTFATSEDGGATYGIMSVEVTTLCGRGVTDDLLCT